MINLARANDCPGDVPGSSILLRLFSNADESISRNFRHRGAASCSIER
jgi:hypothetical protein